MSVLLAYHIRVVKIRLTIALTHCSLGTPKRVIGKQCRPRSDPAEHQMLQNAASDQGLYCVQTVLPLFSRNI